jgi:CheY-like chemotaxis protein
MPKLKILIVDDVASMRKFAKFSLEKSFPNIAVDEAANGKEAQARMEQVEYDLVLCDWEMPDITGDEVLDWMRRHPTLSATPFIMVTSRNDKQSVLKAIESGANSYVVKPYTAEMLAQKITAVMDKFDRRQHERFNANGTVNVHFRDLVARGSIIDLSQGGVFCTFSREDPIPAVFEKVLLDIKLENESKCNGIDSFVIRIQAAEAFIDSENLKLAFKFMEMPETKQSELAKFLSSLRKQSFS